MTVYDSHTRFTGRSGDGYLLRTDAGDEFTADQVVIAAGARAMVPDAIAGCGVDVHTSDTIMRIPELPEHLVIIGGGFVAAEFAHVFSSLGSRVTIVIRGAAMLSHCDDTICERYTDIAGKKWEIRSHRNMTGAHLDGSQTVVELDDGSEIAADVVLVATGRKPNGDLLDVHNAGGVKLDENGLVAVDEYQRTTARGIFALGDVSSHYQLKHVANHEARVVRHNLLRDWDDTDALMYSDHRFVPSAVFTDPQIACVGLTENEARAAGYKINVKVQDYSDVAYGWAMEDTTGFAKIIVEQDSGKIFGCPHHGPPGVVVDSAADPGDELRAARPGDGPRSVLDSPGAAGGDRERAAGVVRRAALAAVAPALTGHLPSSAPLDVTHTTLHTCSHVRSEIHRNGQLSASRRAPGSNRGGGQLRPGDQH